MGDIKMNLKMLAAYMNLSIDKLAELADINVYHLQQVSCGRVRMTADDLLKLSKATGIDPEDIQH